MNKETIFTLIRYALTAVGAYLVGKNFLGTPIDNELWQGIMGAGFALAAGIWGWIDKTETLESIQSSLRAAITFVGGMLVGTGIIKDEVLNALLGGIPILVAYLYSRTSKAKNVKVATGEVRIADLSGVDPGKTQINPDTTPQKTKK